VLFNESSAGTGTADFGAAAIWSRDWRERSGIGQQNSYWPVVNFEVRYLPVIRRASHKSAPP
jgi:hypothetical protein